jgi:dTDP-4-dehydrorhamnose reductase
MKVLIFGGSGRLGFAINKYCEKKSIRSIKVGNKNKGDIKINFGKNNIEKLILNQKPTIIINCIALTDVDKCNYDVQKAYTANVQTIGDITRSIKKTNINCKLVHVSTDQVYNSLEKKEENFEPNINLNNIYSITKYMGELEARKYNKSLIIRTNFFGNSYLKNKPTYSDYIKRKLQERKKINVANNIYFNPIHLDFLIENIFYLLKKNYFGTFNIGSKDCISKYSFAKKIAKKYKLNENYIIKYQSNFHINKRPLGTYMSTTKFKKTTKINLPSINDGILLLS